MFIATFGIAGVVGEMCAVGELLWRHDNLGLVVLATVCTLIVLMMSALILTYGMSTAFQSSQMAVKPEPPHRGNGGPLTTEH